MFLMVLSVLIFSRTTTETNTHPIEVSLRLVFSYKEVDDRSQMTLLQNSMSPSILAQPKNPSFYRAGTLIMSNPKSSSYKNYSEDFTYNSA